MRRFPIGLTAAAAVALAVLIALGVWQLRRLAWKTDLLARVAALRRAPSRPAGAVLTDAAAGKDVGFVRVEASCAPASAPAPTSYRYAVRGEKVGWRLMSVCPLTEGPYASVVLDRGLVDRFAGQMSPGAASFPAPVDVIGVLRAPGKHSWIDTPPQPLAGGGKAYLSVDMAALEAIGGTRVAPYYLAVESERPAPPGVTPAALPEDIPNNHFVYALTWFGLAGVLVWTWAGFVRRRMAGP